MHFVPRGGLEVIQAIWSVDPKEKEGRGTFHFGRRGVWNEGGKEVFGVHTPHSLLSREENSAGGRTVGWPKAQPQAPDCLELKPALLLLTHVICVMGQ